MLFTASAVGSQTTLARIIRMVRRAQSSKPEIGQLADKISAVFVPAVVVIALISAAIWYFFGPAPQIVYTYGHCHHGTDYRLSVRLRLATPMSIISGVGRAAEYGVLVRDADALQRASELDTPVFDKTGTLTEGKPQVVAVKTFAGVDEHTALRLAAALEQAIRWRERSLIKLPTAHCRKSAASAPAALASAARRKVIVCCSVTGRYSTSSISIPLRWKAR